MDVQVKVCCISSAEEAEIALSAGADTLGLVSAMPSGPGVIPEDTIADIASRVRGSCTTFLLTSLTDAREITAQARRMGTTAVQLVDQVEVAAYSTIRGALPDLQIVQVVHVRDEASLRQAEAAAPWVDALLLDSGNPSGPVKELGGTGRLHDWSLSRRIVESVDVPTYLAGGLDAENVAAGIAEVRPYGVDVCSGVRRGGRLDPLQVGRFIVAARQAADRRS